jgi:arylsulfatase A-like enzyme
MQHGVITASHPYGLSLKFKLLPEYLKGLNYVTKAIGKWHLGYFRDSYFPTNRGFDSHVGYMLGKQDYFDHTNFARVLIYSLNEKLEIRNTVFITERMGI